MTPFFRPSMSSSFVSYHWHRRDPIQHLGPHTAAFVECWKRAKIFPRLEGSDVGVVGQFEI